MATCSDRTADCRGNYCAGTLVAQCPTDSEVTGCSCVSPWTHCNSNSDSLTLDQASNQCINTYESHVQIFARCAGMCGMLPAEATRCKS